MTNLWLVIVSYFVFLCATQGGEAKGQLINLSQSKEIKAGDIFSAKLVLWPYKLEDTSNFKNLSGKLFLNFFHVLDVEEPKINKNNADAVEIILDLILVKGFEKRAFYLLDIDDLNIPIELKNIQPLKNDIKIKEFIIQDQNGNLHDPNRSNKYGYILIAIIFLALIILIIKMLNVKNKKPARSDVLEVFFDETSTVNIEFLYINRVRIRNEISQNLKKPFNDFIHRLNNYIFTKDWPDVGKEEVLTHFEKLKKEVSNELR